MTDTPTHIFPDRGAGEWVALEDYAALQAENERLRAALSAADARFIGHGLATMAEREALMAEYEAETKATMEPNPTP
jgi:hypothetical protein